MGRNPRASLSWTPGKTEEEAGAEAGESTRPGTSGLGGLLVKEEP